MSITYNEILGSLLGALNWKGNQGDIAKAKPYGAQILDLDAFRSTMVNLGYASNINNAGLNNRKMSYPAIGIAKNGHAQLVMSADDIKQASSGFQKFITFKKAVSPLQPENGSVSLRKELRRFKPVMNEVFLISLLIGAIALMPIFFNRALFDHVIASGSTYGLAMLIGGVILALAMEIYLRERRSAMLSEFAGRLDHFVSCSVFERLLFLAPLYTERSAVHAQVARLKDFENVREFFTGPLSSLFFEIPLIVIYLVVMGFLAQWLVLIPLVLLGGYALLLSLIQFKLKENSQAAAISGSRRQEFLMESISKLKDIRLAGMENVWNDRYRIIAGEAAYAGFKSSYTAQVLESCSYVLMSLGGIATLGFGVTAVIEGNLSVGALIAAMMLVWRIIAPMQICCASITRLQQLQASTRQVKRLLSLAPEHPSYTQIPALPKIRGEITFNRVSLRYSPDMEPALLGVSFDIKPGQIVAIRGSNGSGKSTILKLILGLYRPQNGGVRIDGVDIRQFNPVALRQVISYVPQNVDFFPGTIRENLLMANTIATEEQCLQSFKEACVYDEVIKLPQGLDTIIEGEGAESVSFLLKQRLNLARAYLRPASIMLFDEASYSLGSDNDIAFEQKIKSLRGKSTVVLVTHREDHMRMSDILLVMNKGELTHAGAPDQVLTVLRGK